MPMRSEAPAVSVIIVSFNTRTLTLRCLHALAEASSGMDVEVLVVDNASKDGSVAAIREAHPSVRLIENRDNRGFGAANNLAIAQSRGEYLLLLNSDAFMPPGSVRQLVEFLEAHPHVAIVGPRLLNEDGSLQRSCYRFPSPWRAWLENLGLTRLAARSSPWDDYSQWSHDSVRSVDWVVGACLMVRKRTIDQAGAFDEGFFMYAEETDWQRRVRKCGCDIQLLADLEVVHLGGASGASERPKINCHFFDSLDRYMVKHHGRAGLLATRAAMVVGCSIRAVGWSLVYAVRPERRPVAAAKIRLASWLVSRQLLHPWDPQPS